MVIYRYRELSGLMGICSVCSASFLMFVSVMRR